MRTTLQIDDDVLQAARLLAATKKVSLGKVLSELARKGLKPTPTFRYRNDFPVFEVAEDAAVFGLEEIKDALDET
jgi:hypothetical protein